MGEMIRRNKVEKYAEKLKAKIKDYDKIIFNLELKHGRDDATANQLIMQRTVTRNLLFDFCLEFDIEKP